MTKDNFFILFIEDDQTQIDFLTQIFKAAEIEYSVSKTIEKAVEASNMLPKVDLFLCDTYLEDQSIFEFFNHLHHNNRALLKTPAIISSSRVDKEYLCNLPEDTHIIGIAEKPYNIESLIKLIKRVKDKNIEGFDQQIKDYLLSPSRQAPLNSECILNRG